MALQLQHIEVLRENFEHYYLCNYKPKSVGTDQLSQSLIRFKECNRIDVEAWTECSITELSKITFSKDLLIIRSLHSQEVTATTKSRKALDWLGHKLEENGIGKYFPDLLYKTKPTRSIKLLSRTEREKELDNVYAFSKIDSSQILVIDDILTTGTTFKEIQRAVRSVVPTVKISFFTLANTDYQALLNSTLLLDGNTYSWDSHKWNSSVSEPSEFYGQLSTLKDMILRDSFG